MYGFIEREPAVLRYGSIFLVLFVAAVIYWPGLNSRFLGDDHINLVDLVSVSDYGHLYYVFGSGHAGPARRPVSLFTFSLQHTSWPESPFDFKLVNLIFHLFNGVLIFLICRLLATLALKGKYCLLLPCLVTGVWLLHPMQLTTTLYTVQRMTILSAFFTLLGIFLFLVMRARQQVKDDPVINAVCGFIIMIFMSLAVFSKENGILLPVFILSIEYTLFNHLQRPKYWKIWVSSFLLLPLACLVVYLGLNFETNMAGYSFRNFTMQERLMTEAAILVDYLRLIIFPRPSAFNLYHDGYQVISEFTSPVFLFSALILTILIIGSILYRKVFPVFSFAIFWFLGGHLLESTYINLELYFEHRNYLPLLGIVFLVTWTALKLVDKFKPRIALIPVIIYCAMILTITVIEVDLWSRPGLQIQVWSENEPASTRGKNDLVTFYAATGSYEQASAVINELKAVDPGGFYNYVQQLDLDVCRSGNIYTEMQWGELINRATGSGPEGLRVISQLDNLTLDVISNQCPSMNISLYKLMLVTLANNSNYNSVQRANFYEFLSSLELVKGDPRKAAGYLVTSNELVQEITRETRLIRILEATGENEGAAVRRAQLLEKLEKENLLFRYNELIDKLRSD